MITGETNFKVKFAGRFQGPNKQEEKCTTQKGGEEEYLPRIKRGFAYEI